MGKQVAQDDAKKLDGALRRLTNRGPCKVGRSPHLAIIEAKLADPAVKIRTLEQAIADAWGESISGESLTRHRDKVCLCVK